MKKLFVSTMFIALVGCSEKGASLSCNNTEVTSLVMNIASKELKEQLFKLFFLNEASILPRDIAEMTYAEFKSKATSGIGKKVLDQTDSTVASIKLTDMRLQGKNETTGMISCAAKLSGKNGDTDIRYTAQLTDEGKLYVEVSGL